MSLAILLPFLLTCLIIEITPGPNMAYLAVLSASEGRKAGFAATTGIATGLFVVGLAAALGIATLVSNSPLAYQILRWGGVVYLLWLAWDAWREDAQMSSGKTSNPVYPAKFFRRGLIVNILNPKAAVFYVAILPKFIAPAPSAITQAITLTIIYVMIATTIHSLLVLLAGTAQLFLEDRKRRMVARRILSLALIVIAVWFAATTGSD
ncbi:LysE family translocator [Alphaproteobacteria bacterium HT1-32]|nr:LysE family translocator [Alphaproteobacteria bacterium HT1-32]